MNAPRLKRFAEIALALGCTAGGAAASLTLVSATTGSYDDSPSWRVLYDSGPAVQATGAIVAVVVASLRLSGATRIAMSVIAAIVLSALSAATTDSLLLGYSTAVLAGVMIGSLVGWSITVAPHLHWAPATVAAGTITGVVLRQPLSDPFVFYPDGSEPTRLVTTDSVTTILLIMSVMLAAGLNPRVRQALPTASGHQDEPTDPPSRGLDAVLGAALAAMSVLSLWWYEATVHSDADSVNEWYPAYLQVAVILVVAMVLGRQAGAILVVAAAWTVTRSGETNWVPDNRAWLLLAVAGVIAGAVLGWKFGRPIIGTAVLAVCAATYLLLRAPFTEVYSAAALFVAPGAAAFSLAGLLRRTRPVAAVLAIAVSGPAVWMFAPRSVFIGISYTGSGDPGPQTIDYAFVSPSVSVAAKVAIPMIVAIIACGIALSMIVRRGTAAEDAPLV